MGIETQALKSFRKQDLANQLSLALGFNRTVFAHQSVGGETALNLSVLTAPPSMVTAGFVQPSLNALLAANIYQFRNNLTLYSSVRGYLVPYKDYIVVTSTQIALSGFVSSVNELFVGLIAPAPETGLNVVSGQALVTTGSLAIGATDFNTSLMFETNKYSNQQIGAVLVLRNGKMQMRNTGNATAAPAADGNYQEPSGAGSVNNLIRFNVAPTGQPDAIIVVSNGLLVNNPTDSLTAQIQSIQNSDLAIRPNAIVGSVSQFNLGIATHTSLQQAITDVATGGTILVLQGTLTENITLAKQLSIYGNGYSSYVNGTWTLNAGASFSTIRDLRMGNDLLINATVNACFIRNVWQATAHTITDNGTANSKLIIQE